MEETRYHSNELEKLERFTARPFRVLKETKREKDKKPTFAERQLKKTGIAGEKNGKGGYRQRRKF